MEPSPVTTATEAGSANAASASRSYAPLERMTRAVIVHTRIVSMKGSRPATTPSRTGSSVLAAEWAIGAEPCPASEENKARLMPHMAA